MKQIKKGLLFITHKTAKYDHIASARIVLDGGCKQIQLRMKDTSPDVIREKAFLLKDICDSYKASLYIDDYPEICKEVQATGVHVGKQDMPPDEARKIVGADAIIGGTANTKEDILRLIQQGVNYVGLGPFRFTETKKGLSPLLGLEGYRVIMEELANNSIHIPVIAIGGITRKDIPTLMETGIAGIALSSTILGADNPVKETCEIIKIIQNNI